MSKKNEEMKRTLRYVEASGRVLFETCSELIKHLLKKPRVTIKLLRPRGGVFNLSQIFTMFAITNRDEEAKFIKRMHHIQRTINRKILSGTLSFDKMDEVTV